MKYKVENMKCGGCVATVQDALEKLPGSTSVSVDLESGIAEIIGDVPTELVMQTLKEEGYPASPME